METENTTIREEKRQLEKRRCHYILTFIVRKGLSG